MTEPTVDPAAELTKLDRLVKLERKSRRRDLFTRIVLAAALALGAWSSLESLRLQHEAVERGRVNRAILVGLEKSGADTKRLLTFTARIDSPAARAAQEAELQALVAQIGCENREVVQEVIAGFERAGLIDTGSIVVTCGGPR